MPAGRPAGNIFYIRTVEDAGPYKMGGKGPSGTPVPTS